MVNKTVQGVAESQIPLKFLDISWWRKWPNICRDHRLWVVSGFAHPGSWGHLGTLHTAFTPVQRLQDTECTLQSPVHHPWQTWEHNHVGLLHQPVPMEDIRHIITKSSNYQSVGLFATFLMHVSPVPRGVRIKTASQSIHNSLYLFLLKMISRQ